MSEFYAEIKGNKSISSRQGTKESGIWCHIRSWNIGVRVSGYIDENGKCCFVVDETGGSNNSKSKLITVIKEK